MIIGVAFTGLCFAVVGVVFQIRWIENVGWALLFGAAIGFSISTRAGQTESRRSHNPQNGVQLSSPQPVFPTKETNGRASIPEFSSAGDTTCCVVKVQAEGEKEIEVANRRAEPVAGYGYAAVVKVGGENLRRSITQWPFGDLTGRRDGHIFPGMALGVSPRSESHSLLTSRSRFGVAAW